jgi:hypothetical protein
MSLQILCEPELEAAKKFALESGGQALLDQLNAQLEFLGSYGHGMHTKCDLHPDFAPHSFTFVMFKKEGPAKPWMYWFNGGLIYQGPDIPADGSSPSLTVSLNPTKRGWFVHT